MTTFSFIDLFAGIGGMRIAFSTSGGECVFSSDYDKYAQKTYAAYFNDSSDFRDILKVNPPGDITQLPPDLIPDHDILAGGFPCQPFSLAGVSQRWSAGKPDGFEDPTRLSQYVIVCSHFLNRRATQMCWHYFSTDIIRKLNKK